MLGAGRGGMDTASVGRRGREDEEAHPAGAVWAVSGSRPSLGWKVRLAPESRPRALKCPPQEGSAAPTLCCGCAPCSCTVVFEPIVAAKPKWSPVPCAPLRAGVPAYPVTAKSPVRRSTWDVKQENLHHWNGSSRLTSFLRDVCSKPSCT